MTSHMGETYIPEWTIGDRLRRIRRDAHLTQAQFAELLQVGAKAYAAWESEANTPGGKALMALAARVQMLYGQAAREFLLGLDALPTPTGPGEPVAGGSPTHRYAHVLAAVA